MTHMPEQHHAPDTRAAEEEAAGQTADAASPLAVRFTDPVAYERGPANIREEWKQLPDGLPEDVRQPFNEDIEEAGDGEKEAPEAASLEPPEFHDPSVGWAEVERRRVRRREGSDRRQHDRGQHDRRQEDRRQTRELPPPSWERPDIPEAFPYGISVKEPRVMEPDRTHDHSDLFTPPKQLHDGDEIHLHL